MRSTVSTSDPVDAPPAYPCLKKGTRYGNVYLMTDESTGVVVSIGADSRKGPDYLGTVCEGLPANRLEDFDGEVTLSN